MVDARHNPKGICVLPQDGTGDLRLIRTNRTCPRCQSSLMNCFASLKKSDLCNSAQHVMAAILTQHEINSDK